jgi:hypothetical protein
VATEILTNANDFSHVTTGVELTEGRHYWEVELPLEDVGGIYIGVTRPNLVGVLLDLNNGSLLFFKNGVQHGPGYAAGSVTGPVVAAV